MLLDLAFSLAQYKTMAYTIVNSTDNYSICGK